MNGLRLLHLAVCSGNVRMLSMLLAAGADRTATDNHGATPLYLAAQCGGLDIARQLLQRSKAKQLHTRTAAGGSVLDRGGRHCHSQFLSTVIYRDSLYKGPRVRCRFSSLSSALGR